MEISLWLSSRCVNHLFNCTYSVENNIGLFKMELRLYMYGTGFGPFSGQQACQYKNLIDEFFLCKRFVLTCVIKSYKGNLPL